jgi:hypothetical protein
MERRQKHKLFTAFLLFILGVIAIRRSKSVEAELEIALTLFGCVVIIISMVINIRYMIHTLKQASRRN